MLQYDQAEVDHIADWFSFCDALYSNNIASCVKEDIEEKELIEWGGESFGMYTVEGAKAVSAALKKVQDRNDLSRGEKLTRIQNSVSRLGYDEIGFSEASYRVWEYLGS